LGVAAGAGERDTHGVERRDEPGWLNWGLGEGFRTQTPVSVALCAVLAVLAAGGLAAILAIRF